MTSINENPEHQSEYDSYIRKFLLCIEVSVLAKKYKSGDNGALLKIIDTCLNNNLPIPAKFTVSFHNAINTWQNGFESLDRAFGVERPNLRKAAEKRKIEMRPLVWQAAKELILNGSPIDEYLFEQVGDRLGLTYATAKKYYYSAKSYYGDKQAALMSDLDSVLEDPSLIEWGRSVLDSPESIRMTQADRQRTA